MILIFGIRSRPHIVGNGNFFCPNCGADRGYVLVRYRRWFTLFFIPIFPVDKGTIEVVRCGTCNTVFRPDVLNAPTSAEFSDNLRSATRVATVAMLRAGDAANPAARQAAVDLVRETGVDNYQDDWLDNDLDAIDIATLADYVGPLVDGLNAQGKETFVSKVARVGLADGELNDAETQVLERLGALLDLSAAHIRGIIVTVQTAPN
jgi:hypothetical protein